jgi:hypothetical protein
MSGALFRIARAAFCASTSLAKARRSFSPKTSFVPGSETATSLWAKA